MWKEIASLIKGVSGLMHIYFLWVDIEYLASFKAEVKMKWLTVLQPAGPFESLLLIPPKIHQARNVSKLEKGYLTQLDPLATCVSPIGAVLLFEDSWSLQFFRNWSPLTHFSAPTWGGTSSLVSIIFWWLLYLVPSHHASTITAKYYDLIPHLKPTPLLHPA